MRSSQLLFALSASSFYASSSSGPAGLLRVSHALLKTVVHPGDTCVDATCGNGYDSLFLARLLFPSSSNPSCQSSKLFCIDVQEGAIRNTTALLAGELGEDLIHSHVKLILGSHAPLPAELHSDPRVKAICFNLGYLPGSADKSIKTCPNTTLQSLEESCAVLSRGGLITCCAYRYHLGGAEEEGAVKAFLRNLNLREWDVNSHVGMQTKGEVEGPVLYTARRR